MISICYNLLRLFYLYLLYIIFHIYFIFSGIYRLTGQTSIKCMEPSWIRIIYINFCIAFNRYAFYSYNKLSRETFGRRHILNNNKEIIKKLLRIYKQKTCWCNELANCLLSQNPLIYGFFASFHSYYCLVNTCCCKLSCIVVVLQLYLFYL